MNTVDLVAVMRSRFHEALGRPLLAPTGIYATDMHSWYHSRDSQLINPSQVASVHFYDSIAVIEKGIKAAPRHIAAGRR